MRDGQVLDDWRSRRGRRQAVAPDPEHSLVTILAVDTVRSTELVADLDPDEAESFLDEVMAFVGRRIEAAGGVLASFHGDGGLAIFGWPDSLEEHADGACEAAWDIQHPDRPLLSEAGGKRTPVTFRIGVHSGLVRFRQLRLGVGSNLDLVGATVYLAAALQKNASPSSILISAKTRELCRNRLDLQLRNDVMLATKINSDVYELLSAPRPASPLVGSNSYPFPIIGRAEEKAELLGHLTRPSKTASTVAVVGEPGIGKSRLAAAVIDDWSRAGGSTLLLRGDTRQSTTPFWAMKSLLSASLGRLAGSPLGLSADELRAAGVPDEDVQRLASILVGGESRGNDRSGVLTSRQIARVLVRIFTKATMDKRVLVLVDDLQAIDPESIDCLSLVATSPSCRHVSLLITGRPEAADAASRLASHVLFLPPLMIEDMEQLAGALRPELLDRPALVSRALSQADGVPFVLEQLLFSIDPDRADRDMPLPESVESLIHGRLNKLTSEAKSLAQVASLLGEECDIMLVASVLERDIGSLGPLLEELGQLGLLHLHPEGRLRFRHGIIADASATTVPRNRQRQLHLKAIDAISSIYANLNEHYERIAFHAMGAGDEENALEYLWLAGLQARRSSATASLQLIFQRVEQCIGNLGTEADERYADFVLMACTALVQVGELAPMKSHLQRALVIVRARRQPEKVCGALCNLAMLCWFEGRYEEGLSAAEEALTYAEQIHSLPHRFAAQMFKANNYHGMGRINRALELTRELCEMLSGELIGARLGATGLPSVVSRAFMGWFLVEVGRNEEALDFSRTALSIACDLNDTYGEILSRNSLGRVLLALRREEEARQCLVVAREIAEREGFDAILPHVSGRLATAMARAGQAERAVRIVEDLLPEAVEERTGRLEMFNLVLGFAEALFMSGQTERAFKAADRALAIARSLNNPPLLVDALSLLNWMGRNTDDSTSHSGQADELMRLCEEFGLVAWDPDGSPGV